MKKYLMIVLALFLSTISLYSQGCPPSAQTTFHEIDVDGCVYRVWICYDCGMPAVLAPYIQVYGIYKMEDDCDNGLSMGEVLYRIYEIVCHPDFINDHLYCEGEIIPCSEGNYQINESYNLCWAKQRNTETGNIEYWACPGSGNPACIRIARYCIDDQTGLWTVTYDSPFINNENNYGNYCEGVSESGITAPDAPAWSDCFELGTTPCDE